MHITHQQEAISRAYVRAVAAGAGLRVQEGAQPDDDSVDLTLSARGPGGTVRSPKLDLQLKCQLGRPTNAPHWPYDLGVKNYEELRPSDFPVPRILVVVVVPDDPSHWIEQSDERLLMRYCGFWLSLRGLPETANTSAVRVQIPRAQRFDVAGLTAIMDRISQGGVP